MRPTSRLLNALLLLVSLALAGDAGATVPPSGTPVPAVPSDPWAAVLPAHRDAVVAQTAGRLPRYKITANVDSSGPRRGPTIEGSLEVTLPAGAGWTDTAWFRLYPNDPAYGDGGLTVSVVEVDGSPVSPDLSQNDTVLRVPLPQRDTGSDTVVSIRFTTTVPDRSDTAFGIFSAKPRTGSVAAAHWYPILAGRTAEGWELAPPSRNGDVVYSNAGLYDIELDVPALMRVALPGAADSGPAEKGRRTVRTAMGPSREVPFLADDDWTTFSVERNGVMVRVHGEPALAREKEQVAGWAADALGTFSARYGPYPYASLDVAMIDLSGALGMEFPALIVLDPDVFGPGHATNPRFPEIVVAHEVAHQWWYGLVENDQYLDAFLDEGLAQYSGAGVYTGDVYGSEEAARQVRSEIRDWYDAARARFGDFVADQPSDAFPDTSAYGMAVYARSALGFAAIREEIGDDAFFSALRQVVADHRFDVIDPGILERAFERSCGCDLEPTWTAWFESDAPPVATPAG